MKSLSFYKGLSWLLVLNLLVKPVWIFFIDRQVQNIVGYEVYGKYFAILNLSFVLFFLTDAGLSNMLNQRIARATRLNVRQLLRIKIFLSLFYLLTCILVAWLSQISQWQILFYVIITQTLNSMFIFCRSLITANQHFTADAWLSVIDKFLMVLICGAIIYTGFFGNMDLMRFLEVQMFCTATALIIALSFLFKNHLIHSGKKENLLIIVKQVLPFALIVLLMATHYRLDGFLLERIHRNGAMEAGIYASAYRLVDAANMVGYLVAAFLIPFIARHQNDPQLVNPVIKNARHGLMFYSIGIVSFAVIFSGWIQETFYHSDLQYNSMVIELSLASLPGYFLVHLYSAILTAISKFRSLISILIVSVLLNLSLNLLLIPTQGALGCSISALISQSFSGIACYLIATRENKMRLDLKGMGLYILYGLMLTLLFYAASVFVKNVWMIILITGVILIVIVLMRIKDVKRVVGFVRS